jgi:hypothetical protein
MTPHQNMQTRIKALKKDSSYYENELGNQVQRIVDSLKLENILKGLRNLFTSQFWRRRTLYALGASAVVFMLLRMAVGGKRPMRILKGRGAGAVVVADGNQRTGFFTRLIQDAVRTFLLMYARKMLTDFLNRQRKDASSR